MVALPLPVFFNVIDCDELLPSCTLPKDKLAGLALTEGGGVLVVPVPLTSRYTEP